MNAVEFAIKKPVVIFVGIILILLFGLIGLFGMPYQLTPTVTEPEITVDTMWTGATPYEVERDVIEEQEKVLKGINGLTEMSSESSNNRGRITLKFEVGTDIDNALLRVSNKMNEVPNYPAGVDKPIISSTGSSANPVIWMMLKTLPGNPDSIDHYRTYFEEEVRQDIERVDGVAALFIFGGTENEMQVVVDPEKLAAHRLTLADLTRVLQGENANISAGNMDLGRREIRIRTVGQYNSPEEIGNVVISSTGQRRITVGDVATVRPGYEKPVAAMIHNGENGIVCGVQPETGVNVLTLTDEVEKVVKELNAGQLKAQGLELDWSYDQRPYINGSIDLVKQNIMIGGLLAMIVLITFLQSFSSTIIVGAAIPISVIGTFIFMSALGRNLNVVSLAGISFAVGMLVDNAIVVLENIDRHMSMGKSVYRACLDGANEVWGAVVASTATTVAVFLPVVFIEEEAGQLFKDIAIAVTCAISLSLFISVLVIPMLSNLVFRLLKVRKSEKRSLVTRFGGRIINGVMSVVGLALRNAFTRIATVTLLTSVSLLLAWSMFPKMEYLPQGNQNLVLTILIPPPGLSYEERADIGGYLNDAMQPRIGVPEFEDGTPGIKDAFYIGHSDFMMQGVVSTQEQRAGELVPFFMGLGNTIPGFYAVSFQTGIFQSDIGGGRVINVDLSGPSIEQLTGGGGALFGAIMGALPGSQVRPVPSLELTFPEVRIKPDRDKLRAVGMSTSDFGQIVDMLMDGRKIDDYKAEGQKTIDLVVKADREDVKTPEELYQSLVVLPGGQSVPLSALASMERTTGITQIRHLERRRTITLQVTPPADIPMEQAMETIRNGLVPKLEQGPLKGIRVSMSGAADKLTQTRIALQDNFLLAVVITYLLMAALFGNFLYPFIILFTVPLAAAGGILGLKLENWFVAPQPMDVLTMLGFVILIGIVVNNAILIVHQALNNIREHGMEPKPAVLESVRTRLRPIYMSACTSIFGMLPLAIAPGPGSELYRGLGSVVLGGLALSTVFTVFVIPSLLMFFIGMEKKKIRNQ